MTPGIATVVYTAGILGLFVLDRHREAVTSKGLWIPVIWLWIVGSRDISQWLAIAGFGTAVSFDSPEQYLEGNAVDRVFYTGLLIVGLIILAGRGPRIARLLRANLPILLFFAYCVLSVLWSEYPFVAFKRWTKAVGDFVMVLIVLSDCDWVAALKRLLARVGFVLIPLSVLFLKYYPELSRSYKRWSGKSMYTGVTTTKNLLGVICLIYGLGSLWRLLAAWQDREDPQRIQRVIAHGVILAMTVWLLWMANSMTSLICFLLGGALIAVTSFRPIARKTALVHLVVALMICASFSVLFLGAGTGVLEGMGRDPTLTGRDAIWNLVLSLNESPLFGAGFESFWLGERLEKVWRVMPGIQEAHNGYLELYLNLGWIGVALLIIIMVQGYRNVIVEFRRDSNVGRLLLAYCLVGIVYSFTEAGFRMLFPVWIFFLMAITADPHRDAPDSQPQSFAAVNAFTPGTHDYEPAFIQKTETMSYRAIRVLP